MPASDLESDQRTQRPPHLERLFEGPAVDGRVLSQFKDHSMVSVRQLQQPAVVELCRLAALLESHGIGPYRPLADKIVITAFFEASTRTRTSFESAVLRLGGDVISIPEAQITGVMKGESLSDIGEMFNAYGDLVVMRHTETSAPDQILQNLRLPLINAGNGTGEHPTQALADWYALLKWRPELAEPALPPERRLHLGILGTTGSLRAVKSFLLMSLLFGSSIRKVTVISEMVDPFGADILDHLGTTGFEFEVTQGPSTTLHDFDVIYMSSLASPDKNRRTLDSAYKLHGSSDLKPDAVILHPLPRLDELSTDLDNTPYNLYFSQAHGAVFIFQALLMAILGRIGRLPESIEIRTDRQVQQYVQDVRARETDEASQPADRRRELGRHPPIDGYAAHEETYESLPPRATASDIREPIGGFVASEAVFSAADLHGLVEEMVPDLRVPSAPAVAQARRNALARSALAREFGLLTSAEIAEIAGSKAKNRAALANRWMKEGRVFAVPHGGQHLYPGFQFDAQGQPLGLIAKILSIVGNDLPPWALALWFTSRSGWLDGRRPVDLLETKPQAVVEAARRQDEQPAF